MGLCNITWRFNINVTENGIEKMILTFGHFFGWKCMPLDYSVMLWELKDKDTPGNQPVNVSFLSSGIHFSLWLWIQFILWRYLNTSWSDGRLEIGSKSILKLADIQANRKKNIVLTNSTCWGSNFTDFRDLTFSLTPRIPLHFLRKSSWWWSKNYRFLSSVCHFGGLSVLPSKIT